MKKIGVLASGGDTPGMNAAIRAVVKCAEALDMDVMGIRYGFQGLMEGLIQPMTAKDVKNIVHKGGTILKTARVPEFKEEAGQKKAIRVADAYGLEGVIVIGGDGSMRGAAALTDHGLPTVCMPGTIDNDLAYTDYSIGFDTAVSGVIIEIIKVRDTMESHDCIGVVEVMGNQCGDIALYAGLASACDYIIVPEVGYDFEQLAQSLTKRDLVGVKTSMIIAAEGAAKSDELAQKLRERTGLVCKSVVLGYTQRGGYPSAFDRILASKLAEHAVKLLYNNIGHRAVGQRDGRVVDMDIHDALAAVKPFDMKLYNLANDLVAMV